MKKHLNLLLLLPLLLSCGGNPEVSTKEDFSSSQDSEKSTPVSSSIAQSSEDSSEEVSITPSSSEVESSENSSSDEESNSPEESIEESEEESLSSSEGSEEESSESQSSLEESSQEESECPPELSSEQSSEEHSEEPSEEPSVEPSEEPSEEPSVEPSEEPSEESSEEPLSSDSRGDSYIFVLNRDNGRINDSYSDSESVNSSAKDAQGNPFEVGYKNCMTSGNKTYDYAQMRKTNGELYSKTSLGSLLTIQISFSTSNVLNLELSKGSQTYSIPKIQSETLYSLPSGYTNFRLTSGANAVYIGWISICYSLEEMEIDPTQSASIPEEPSSESSSSTSTYSASSQEEEPFDPEKYYQNVSESSSGSSLKTTLFNIIKDHTNKGYDYAYEAYPSTDVDDDGKIIDIYSSYHWDPITDHQGAPGNGNYSAEGQMFNREHTIPQSIFNSGQPMKSDLYHLLPTDAYVNNQRSNYPHAEVGEDTKYVSTNGTKVGQSITQGLTGYACEVPDEYKGDVARIYFYMVTRYQDKLTNWGSYEAFDGTAFPALSSWAKDLYLKWADEDPVSEKEIRRNDAVYKIQKNRNPFVDVPEFAHRIWG